MKPGTKSERITILADQQFKAFLSQEAEKEGVSVAELVRRRCERQPSGDEALLASLAAELRSAVAAAKSSLKAGLEEANTVLAELAAKRMAPSDPVAAAPRARATRAGGRR